MADLTAATIRWTDGLEISVYTSNVEPLSEPTFQGYSQSAEIFGIAQSPGALSKLAYLEDVDDVFQPLRFLEETEYELVLKVPITKAECIKLQQAAKTQFWPFLNPAVQRSLRVVTSRLWLEADHSTLVPAIFNSHSQVGTVDLSVLDENHDLLIEVVSGKIDYETEYKMLLSDISKYHLELAYDLGASSSLSLSLARQDIEDFATILFHLRKLMSANELPAAIEEILADPFEGLEVSEFYGHTLRGKPNARLISKRLSSMDFVREGPLWGLFRGYTPRSVPSLKKHQSHDVPENRYVKKFLQELIQLLRTIHQACERESYKTEAIEVAAWLAQAEEWLQHRLWIKIGNVVGVPSNSQKLQRTPRYEAVLRSDLVLRQALALPWKELGSFADLTYAQTKPVPDLYEYWCFFVIRDILRDLLGPPISEGKGLLEKSATGLSIRLSALSDGTGSIFTFGDAQIVLFYNRTFTPKAELSWGEWSGSYSISFDPDISIAINATSGLTHWLNFDAKYKLQKLIWADLAPQPTASREYKQEDVNKMHCYRDAILGTRGAYILFPGRNVAGDPYVRKPASPRQGFGFPSVGAFALRPGSELHRETLKAFISKALNYLGSCKSYGEETGAN